VAVTIVVCREANVLGDTFRETALERFRVLAIMFSLIISVRPTIDKDEDTYF
jgi:hypothetical protein